MSASALKQYMELAGTIANQAQAIHEGKVPAKQLWAQVGLLENNIKTLKAWTPRPEELEEDAPVCPDCDEELVGEDPKYCPFCDKEEGRTA